jgi:hypothetical protein
LNTFNYNEKGGEKMNRRTGIISLLAFFVLLALVSPAFAESTKGQWVPAKMLKTGSRIGGEAPTVRVTDGGIVQIRDGIRILEGDTLVIGSQEYNIYSYNVEGGAWNSKTGVLNYHYDAVWSIPAQGSDSGFSGNIKVKYYNFNPFTNKYSFHEYQCLLQGFGDFVDQTLMLSSEGPPGSNWTGYCLKG